MDPPFTDLPSNFMLLSDWRSRSGLGRYGWNLADDLLILDTDDYLGFTSTLWTD